MAEDICKSIIILIIISFSYLRLELSKTDQN